MLKHLIPESDFWHKYWNKNCDPRSVDFWLMHDGPWKLLAISLCYALTIVAGVRMMRNRKPFEVQLPMLVYNVTLIVVNAYFLYKSFWWINYGTDLLNFTFPSPHDRSARAQTIIGLYQCYLWTKFLDYLDTFFFILRKKNSQLTMLHIYHHVSVPVVGWISNWISPTMPVLGLFAMLNSFCHVLMYTYYALASFGPRVQPYLWWKKYLTQIQLIQFAIIGLYGLCLNLFHTGYPFVYRMMPISQAIIYLVLFGDFYYKSYKRSDKTPRVRQGGEEQSKQD